MARITAKEVEPVLLNKSDLCKSLGISTTAFDKWAVPIHSKKGRERLYTVADVVANRVGNERKKQQSSLDDFDPEKPNIDYERYRLTKAQADGQELKNEKDRKEVVEVLFSTFFLSKIAAQIAPILDQIPLQIKRKFPDTPEKMIDSIKSEVITGQNLCADLAGEMEGLLDEYLASTD